ncbi:unnamed protein product [Cuscuta campestris]|uniref:Uncharacterized protein n=1 Tax=Cuscuta campestris TaxID=132261 RepID=A0A484KK75_9ASTE|nr:unnamed protein product [Cuscuta campestris]
MDNWMLHSSKTRSPPPTPPHETLFQAPPEDCACDCSSWRSQNEADGKEDPWRTMKANKKKKKKQVFLEGYVETSEDDELGRTKSLTDDDLEELKGCLDLGFGFNYEEIPELCNTLPALELCYSMSQKYLDEHQRSPESMSETASSASAPIPNWRFSSPGDDPEDVKARLKYWAQTVACTVRLCN